MKNLRVVGGPFAQTVRLIDPETGLDVPGITRMELVIEPGEPIRAQVNLIVDVDMEIDPANITFSEIFNMQRMKAPA
jgi:hypothetical protein